MTTRVQPAAGSQSDLANASNEELDLLVDKTLRQRFGYDVLLPGQQDVIRHLLRGNSSAAVFPTGGGKSLCYQLTSLLLPGLTLVVSPLIALMKDQIDALRKRGIAAARMDSTLSNDAYEQAMGQLRNGELQLLYVAPERFNNERFRELLQRLSISLFAIDEAHCISEWGHAFRPDYLKLTRFADKCGSERKLALTATATRQVLDDICREFQIKPECAVRTGFYRPNLTLDATSVSATDRDKLLIARLNTRPRGATIVYVTLQKTAMEVARKLEAAGLIAQPYHAGLKSEVRAETQDWFLANDDAVIVATIAFGMGVDKSNIRYVYHYNLPKSLENYAQEIGRAGRDGETSICESLVCSDDLRVHENFIHGDTPDCGNLESLIADLFSRGNAFSISLNALSTDHNIRQLVIRTLITYLELDGYLKGGTPRYSEFRFKPHLPSPAILAHFEGERRTFVTNLLKQSRKAKTWFHIDVAAAALHLQADRARVVRALDYLADQGWIELATSKVVHCYEIEKTPDDLKELAMALYDRCLARRDREIGRLQQQLAWFERDDCQTNALAAHFDETRTENCGHCYWCSHQTPMTIEPPAKATMDDAVWRKAELFRAEHAKALELPSEFARFLCGIRSPNLSRNRLTGQSLFGVLDNVSFDEVLQRASA